MGKRHDQRLVADIDDHAVRNGQGQRQGKDEGGALTWRALDQ